MERSLTLEKLACNVPGVQIRGNKKTVIKGLSLDSRTTCLGDLFIAKKGLEQDGSLYISQAIVAGAKAVLTDLYNPFLNVSQLVHPNPSEIIALLAANFYGHPASKLSMVAVTGSKGKTTTTYLISHLLEKLGEKCGLLGTVELAIGEFRFPSSQTTQDPITNHKWLAEMVRQKCRTAILEVSSHGLDQKRVDEILWDIAIFTNLYPDHLDYHETIERYAKAKSLLFSKVKGTSILNIDSPWAEAMQAKGKIFSIGVEKQGDFQATELKILEDRICFSIEKVPFTIPIVGYFNVYNALSAIAVAYVKGYSLLQIANSLLDFSGVPGRLQKVPNGRGVHVFVDYAHTGEALFAILDTLRKMAKKKIIVIFGCGGQRDVGRRSGMAQAAEKLADVSIITTDNPRKEDPEKICCDILKGFTKLDNVFVELDRKMAIAKGIAMAESQDIVLIAGKGHEKNQVFSHQTIVFDDVEIARQLCNS